MREKLCAQLRLASVGSDSTCNRVDPILVDPPNLLPTLIMAVGIDGFGCQP